MVFQLSEVYSVVAESEPVEEQAERKRVSDASAIIFFIRKNKEVSAKHSSKFQTGTTMT